MRRKCALITGEYYHVFNKSIAGIKIFNSQQEFSRMINMIYYYRFRNLTHSFSVIYKQQKIKNLNVSDFCQENFQNKEKIVSIIAYCIMPNHLHLILKQTSDNGISKFIGDISNSYARYFNKKISRLGPLWAGKFKNIHIAEENYLCHLSRYIHLNPTTAGLVRKPEDWPYSSYKEYIGQIYNTINVSEPGIIRNLISDRDYKNFIEERIDEQKELSLIKKFNSTPGVEF